MFTKVSFKQQGEMLHLVTNTWHHISWKPSSLRLSFANGNLEEERKDTGVVEDTQRMNLAEGRS